MHIDAPVVVAMRPARVGHVHIPRALKYIALKSSQKAFHEETNFLHDFAQSNMI